MVRPLPVLLALFATGCAHRTVRVEVAPAPAVAIATSTVAVVAQDRECRSTADALIHALGRVASIDVDPRADVRLIVFGCGTEIGWTLRQEVDATGDRTESIQKADLTGHSHAVVAVNSPAGNLAHLVGSSHDGHAGSWGVNEMFRSRRAIRQNLSRELAADLVNQLNPLPQQLARRVYPNASEGSARDLHTLAVRAEQRGDLGEALRLATAALRERPSDRAALYLQDLRRRVAPFAEPSPQTDSSN